MNAKLCKRLRREAKQLTPLGNPYRFHSKVEAKVHKGGYSILKYVIVNAPNSIRGVYRQLKRDMFGRRNNNIK